jgi:hypothetical protein
MTADVELTRLLNAAHTGHALGRDWTGMVLHDVHADQISAANHMIGRREAARRMLSLLRTQRRFIYVSRCQYRLLDLRMRRHAYRGRRQAAHAIPVVASRYHRSAAPPGPIRPDGYGLVYADVVPRYGVRPGGLESRCVGAAGGSMSAAEGILRPCP